NPQTEEHPPAPPTDDYSYMSTPTLEMFHAPYVQVRKLAFAFPEATKNPMQETTRNWCPL
ncbi:MAG: hypothetical protein ACR2IE_15480, partial [Candidatus Sumerlaeaceae bacterium]